MKRNTLTPGQDYWFDTSTDWEANGRGSRVRVLTMQELADVGGYGYGADKREPLLVTIHNGDVVELPRVREARKGVDRVDSVLCQRLTDDGQPFVARFDRDPEHPKLIRAAYLRGPWSELNDRFTAEREARAQREAERKAEQDAVEAQGRALIARARVLGVDIADTPGNLRRNGYMVLSQEALDALILRAEGVDL